MPQFLITVDEDTAEDLRHAEDTFQNVWIGSWGHDNLPVQYMQETDTAMDTPFES